jgi:hypothetical protein
MQLSWGVIKAFLGVEAALSLYPYADFRSYRYAILGGKM